MSLTGARLEQELVALSPLSSMPEKIDTRTAEGKRWKGRILAEAIALREKGYTLTEIGTAFGIGPTTLGMWFVMVGRSDLFHSRKKDRDKRPANGTCYGCGAELPDSSGPGRRRKYCDEDCRQVALGGAGAEQYAKRQWEAQERRKRIQELRCEYRRRRAAGERLPWHVLRVEPSLTVEQQMEVRELEEAQRRDGEKIGARPWLVSIDAPLLSHDPTAEGTGQWTILETLALADERASGEIEALMIANGSEGMPSRHVMRRPWRVRRPVSEMYPEAS